MSPRFQIVIVLYNSARWIDACLRAVSRLDYPDYSVVVLDNASDDDGADRVERNFPEVHLIRSRYNRGFAGGNNFAAARQPRGDYLLLLNPDTEIAPDCLNRLADAFERQPRLAVAGCKLLGSDRQTIEHVGGMLRPNGLSYHRGEGETDAGQYAGLIACDYVEGAAMAVRREVWDALGGFDEAFNPAYFEEVDFCRRAKRTGWEVAVVAEAAVVHHQDTAAQIQNRRFLEMIFRGRARYLVKHYRARDWIFRYLPAELKWLFSPNSKTYRRIALRTLWEVASGTPPRS